MKTLICLISLFFLSLTSSYAKNFSLELERKEGNETLLKISTIEHKSSMCYLTPVSYSIELPDYDSVNREGGKIFFDVMLLPDTICMMAFGPHRSTLHLMTGKELPLIPDGGYDIIINGHTEGEVVVRGGKVEFVAE